jgi:hypothetical protein
MSWTWTDFSWGEYKKEGRLTAFCFLRLIVIPHPMPDFNHQVLEFISVVPWTIYKKIGHFFMGFYATMLHGNKSQFADYFFF